MIRKTWREHFEKFLKLPSGNALDSYNIVTVKSDDELIIYFATGGTGYMATAPMDKPVLKPGEIVMLENGNAFFCFSSKVEQGETPNGGIYNITVCKGQFNTSIWNNENNSDIVKGWGEGRYILQPTN